MKSAHLVFSNAVKCLQQTESIVESEGFKNLVQRLVVQRGRVWTLGMGKAGNVAQKLASTLACNCYPAAFIHAGEALHGDFGAINHGDMLIAFSNSGKTNEVIQVVEKANGHAFVALITGDSTSELAKKANIIITFGKIPEACPLGLTPTTSIMVMLAIADALAMEVQHRTKLDYAQYARNHHEGYLGQVAREKSKGSSDVVG